MRDVSHRLVLVRHAKSSWDDPNLADHDRPLAPRGEKALGRMRQHLEELGIRPDLVLCSSARRTKATLRGIEKAFGHPAIVEVEDRLYAADARELLARLRLIGDDVGTVLVVGHNPGIADLIDLLVARDDAGPGAEDVPTGAIAVVSVAGPWPSVELGTGTLESFWRPRPAR
jgi:phosphohistidine phosphatase